MYSDTALDHLKELSLCLRKSELCNSIAARKKETDKEALSIQREWIEKAFTSLEILQLLVKRGEL